MLSRNIFRYVIPIALRTSAAALRKKPIMPTSRISPVASTNLHIRNYSQETKTEEIPAVDFDYVKKATTSHEVVLIDVREPDEVKEHGKIPNSVNIPLGSINTSLAMSDKEFQERYKIAKPSENTEIIFYCMIGKRSGKATQSAISLGFKNAKNYTGSWLDWAVKNQ